RSNQAKLNLLHRFEGEYFQAAQRLLGVHVWTAPAGPEIFGGGDDLIGSSHVSGLWCGAHDRWP
ncbi:MAG TPA: hypothetical protein VFS23_12545, partial [Vicinamibacterales bacterium]|nr:hypothetical protein [Vicinamibacterales bacterium]